jgi:hypothetical protein
MYKAKVFNGVKTPVGKPITGKGFFSDDHDLIDTPNTANLLKTPSSIITPANNPLPESFNLTREHP